jgi:hypothetical protein
MPAYTLAVSFILTPLGVAWYFKMALAGRNWGIIRPKRKPEGEEDSIIHSEGTAAA